MSLLLARNTAPFSDNKIHDDRVAAEYGFRGGLVPGVTVYGYMASAVVARLSRDWLERGWMQVRFQEPTYEGDQVVVRIVPGDDGAFRVTAERSDGTVCGTGSAGIGGRPAVHSVDFEVRPLPAFEERPLACWEAFVPGAAL